ncbi:hypothetical protein [Microbacterium sp. KR10-403]|uniref:hypothetical protein n=1 Tax=Microbacterium sp. KR10-403 TaxID=3158581 RepID=UPI0032E4C831
MSLFDSSNKGVKFANIGDEITGTIAAAPYERQQTKFGTNEADFWPNGDPKMQVLVPLKTSLRDDANDDGERTLYVASKHMKQAIGQAIRAANVADVAPGGTLTVKYIGNSPDSKNPANPAKMYAAQYTPPASAFAGQPAAQPAQPAQQAQAAPAQYAAPQPAQQPAQAPAPVGTPGGLTVEQLTQVGQLRAAGIPDETIATAVRTTVDVLNTIPF